MRCRDVRHSLILPNIAAAVPSFEVGVWSDYLSCSTTFLASVPSDGDVPINWVVNSVTVTNLNQFLIKLELVVI